jgi:hypothetical protein
VEAEVSAPKGQEIVCDCAQPSGRFHKDLDDRASISSNDIEIPLPVVELGRWVCPTCKATVAERFGDRTVAQPLGDRWRVRTRNGWLE